ncbi:hypothetical protein V3C99_012649, partial [Haemonchus contortus]
VQAYLQQGNQSTIRVALSSDAMSSDVEKSCCSC